MSEADQLIPTPSVFGENGNFLLERELGRGGMGGVYMGRDKMLDRPVAVKVMLKEYGSDAEFVEKFKKEAQAAARLIHPNIAQIYSYGIAQGMPYIAMELVAGGSLDGLMRTHGATIEIPRVMKICEQVAQALRCAADQGLVHGDVKPENVLLDANGNAKLVDFGLAAMQKDTTEIWGTPYYIAPEKVKRQGVDYRADMYSLGGTIYHALTGVAPFEGDDAGAVVRARFQGPPKKPSEVRPGISPQIDFLVMKMLAVEPADRYPSFEALLEDFKKVMTTGLGLTTKLSETAAMPTDVAAGGAAGTAASAAPKTGGKKLVLKGKRKMTVHREASVSGDGTESGNGAPTPGAPAPLVEDDGSGEAPKDNLLAKVFIVIGSVIGAFVVVAVLLVWFVVSGNSEAEEKRNQALSADREKVSAQLAKTRAIAVKTEAELSAAADEAESEAGKQTQQMRKLLTGKYTQRVIDLLQPAPSEELVKAIASTNTAAAVAAPVAAPATTNAAPAATNAVPAAPATPAPAGDAPAAPAAEAPAAEAAPADNGLDDTPPIVIKKINEMWEKAYACRAAEIRLHVKLAEIVADIDKAVAGQVVEGMTTENRSSVFALATGINERFDAARASVEPGHKDSDWEAVLGAPSRIKKIGEQQVKTTSDRLYREKCEADRKAAKLAEQEAEKAAKEAAAAEHAKKVEEETAAAKAKFDAIVAAGAIRQLDWKGARRQLENFKNDLVTAEGQIAADKEMKKIDCMELMQNVFIKNMKDYTFTRAPKDKKNLRGCTVTAVDASSITYLKKGAKKPTKLPWQSFLRDYHANLDEVISKFILKPGALGPDGKNRITAKDRFNAITGIAFVLRLACSDDPSSSVYAEKILKEAITGKTDDKGNQLTRGFTALFGQTKEFFPDIDFKDVESKVAAEQL